MRVVSVQDDLRALGAELIWVLEATPLFQPGTSETCLEFMSEAGATEGWCVGDDETEPLAQAFDDSDFSEGRGFDIVVPRDTMTIEYTTNHGTPGGNDNPTASEYLDAVRGVIEGL